MSAMATLSSSEDELSFGPRDVSLTAADFEESGDDSDFPAESSSGEKSASDAFSFVGDVVAKNKKAI